MSGCSAQHIFDSKNSDAAEHGMHAFSSYACCTAIRQRTSRDYKSATSQKLTHVAEKMVYLGQNMSHDTKFSVSSYVMRMTRAVP